MDPVSCEHWRDSGKADSGVCALNYYGGRPSRGTCAACIAAGRNQPGDPTAAATSSRGLGDTVAKAIQAVTLGLVRPCGGCEERRKLLNRLIPYADPPDPDSRAPDGR